MQKNNQIETQHDKIQVCVSNRQKPSRDITNLKMIVWEATTLKTFVSIPAHKGDILPQYDHSQVFMQLCLMKSIFTVHLEQD